MSKEVLEVNAQTGEIIVREYTETELTQRAEQLKKHKAIAKAAAERATAKQAVLDRLGITADEATLLLG